MGPCPPAQLTRVSLTPEVQRLMAELRPIPGMPLRRSQKTCQQLHFAIDSRDEAAVLKLLLQRADPNISQPGSTLSPLHRAFNAGSAPIATLLAISGANLDEPTGEGYTPLMRGVRCGFSDTFTSLIYELGARIDAVDGQGWSALHHAAASMCEDDTIPILVAAGAELELEDFSGRTPLIAAAENGRLSNVDRLIEYGADIEVRLPSRKTALHVAISRRNVALTKLLADRGAYLDQRFNDHTALTFAIFTACTDIAKILIESGADVNLPSATGTFPLLSAVATGNLKIVEALISRGATVENASPSGYTPLHMAAHKNRLEILPILMQAGSPLDPINDQGETPLAIAVSLGHCHVAKMLVQYGADVDHSPDGGESLLITALRKRDIQMTSLLMESGADLVTPDGEDGGTTPIHLAAQLGLEKDLSIMIRRGVNLDTTIWSGYTPLFMAVEAGHVHIIRAAIFSPSPPATLCCSKCSSERDCLSTTGTRRGPRHCIARLCEAIWHRSRYCCKRERASSTPVPSLRRWRTSATVLVIGRERRLVLRGRRGTCKSRS
jgi:ankyrin repeat protein